MAVPKKKVSKSRRDLRRTHDTLTTSVYTECPKCGELTRPHHVCPSCGFYNKKQVIVQEKEAIEK